MCFNPTSFEKKIRLNAVGELSIEKTNQIGQDCEAKEKKALTF
jgi:hypothetical protein